MNVSVICAVKNRSKAFERCLYSWKSQTYPFEFIVVDDGSTENIKSVVDQNFPEAKYVRLESMRDRTPAVAWNSGYKVSQGDFVIVTNGDLILSHNAAIQDILDSYKGNRVSVLTYFLSKENTRDLDTINWKENPNLIAEMTNFWSYREYNQTNINADLLLAGLTTYVAGQTREDWDFIGLFREEDFQLGADQDLYLREVIFEKYADTAKITRAYHQWHSPPQVNLGASYIYKTERQARLLDPAEREK